jgi:hypothetical protein
MKMTRAIFSFLALLLIFSPSASLASQDPDQRQSQIAQRTVRDVLRQDLADEKLQRQQLQENLRAERAEIQISQVIKLAERMTAVRIRVLAEQKRRLSATACARVESIDIATEAVAAINRLSADLENRLEEIKNADTAEEARRLLREVIGSTKVMSVYHPTITGLCLAGRILDLIDLRLAPELETLEASGDTAAATALLSAARENAQAAADAFQAVLSDPATEDARSKIQLGRDHLKQARQDLGQFRDELAKLTAGSV